jgi:hypothetical protein
MLFIGAFLFLMVEKLAENYSRLSLQIWFIGGRRTKLMLQCIVEFREGYGRGVLDNHITTKKPRKKPFSDPQKTS